MNTPRSKAPARVLLQKNTGVPHGRWLGAPRAEDGRARALDGKHGAIRGLLMARRLLSWCFMFKKPTSIALVFGVVVGACAQDRQPSSAPAAAPAAAAAPSPATTVASASATAIDPRLLSLKSLYAASASDPASAARLYTADATKRFGEMTELHRRTAIEASLKDEIAKLAGNGEPRVSVNLMRALVTHAHSTHVRELEALLWRAVATSRGGSLELTDAVAAEIVPSGDNRAVPAIEVSAEAVRAALAKHDGVQEKVWRELGFANRYVLKRLMKKYGIKAGEEEAE